MNISVIGAGAIGLLYAARLALAGAAVTVYTRTEEQAQWLSTRGIVLKTSTGDHTARVSALALADRSRDSRRRVPEWMLLTVKQTALDKGFLDEVKALISPEDALLCLQNGIGHLERLADALPGTGCMPE